MKAHHVYLSLGSNLGDRQAHLQRALDCLGQAGLRIEKRSSFYETEPLDLIEQPSFLNLVVSATTVLEPGELLDRIQAIEFELGRVRRTAKGPRTIDIDVLLFDQESIASPRLTIPHPRMAERRFVLEPLAEIEPQLRVPGIHATIETLLVAARNQRVTRLRE